MNLKQQLAAGLSAEHVTARSDDGTKNGTPRSVAKEVAAATVVSVCLGHFLRMQYSVKLLH